MSDIHNPSTLTDADIDAVATEAAEFGAFVTQLAKANNVHPGVLVTACLTVAHAVACYHASLRHPDGATAGSEMLRAMLDGMDLDMAARATESGAAGNA